MATDLEFSRSAKAKRNPQVTKSKVKVFFLKGNVANLSSRIEVTFESFLVILTSRRPSLRILNSTPQSLAVDQETSQFLKQVPRRVCLCFNFAY